MAKKVNKRNFVKSKYVKKVTLQQNINLELCNTFCKTKERDFGKFLVMGNCFGEPEVSEDRNVDPVRTCDLKEMHLVYEKILVENWKYKRYAS